MSIQLEKVSYIYSKDTPFETLALKNVNVSINDGEFVGVMGQTGSGKSTFLQIIAGLMEPTQGIVRIDNEDIAASNYDRLRLREKIGFIFQYPEYQLFEKTVADDVAFGLKYSGLSKVDKTQRVKEVLERVGIDYEKYKDTSPFALSGGEKRKVAIAGSIIRRPKILILDEPIAGLDPLARDSFLSLLKQLNEEGITLVMVSHDADSLSETAKRIIVFDQGEIIMDGATQQVFSNVKRMEDLHLSVSQSRHVAEALKKAGCPIQTELTTYSELLTRVKQFLRGE
ncbi:ATP-binding cassette domain-containing protein [Fundicoccus culcitae]|uniref:ATP-binding cassette domain-containing protein n=1 Tax=Fundicoccus culcitae TaxID=2969821 RepID=A0ABY5P7N6_9LACT|nr:ATP-binding cassette domain-containing protein [Fundicoccus culcitae]UUX34731.1 ATP-binding cassette domain-containing protein [Fundicoccus culcitae]